MGVGFRVLGVGTEDARLLDKFGCWVFGLRCLDGKFHLPDGSGGGMGQAA